MKYTNSEKKALYESIMQEAANTVKRMIIEADMPKPAKDRLDNLESKWDTLSSKAKHTILSVIDRIIEYDKKGDQDGIKRIGKSVNESVYISDFDYDNENMKYTERKSLYESIMNDVAKSVKRRLNEADTTKKEFYMVDCSGTITNIKEIAYKILALYTNEVSEARFAYFGRQLGSIREWDVTTTKKDILELIELSPKAKCGVETETFECVNKVFEQNPGYDVVVFTDGEDETVEDLSMLDDDYKRHLMIYIVNSPVYAKKTIARLSRYGLRAKYIRDGSMN